MFRIPSFISITVGLLYHCWCGFLLPFGGHCLVSRWESTPKLHQTVTESESRQLYALWFYYTNCLCTEHCPNPHLTSKTSVYTLLGINCVSWVDVFGYSFPLMSVTLYSNTVLTNKFTNCLFCHLLII